MSAPMFLFRFLAIPTGMSEMAGCCATGPYSTPKWPGREIVVRTDGLIHWTNGDVRVSDDAEVSFPPRCS